MRKSIYFRNFLATALIVLFSLALLGGLFSLWMYRQSAIDSEEAMEIALHETARYIIAQHVYNESYMNHSDLNALLCMISEITGLDILVTNVDGVVYVCSKRCSEHLGKQIPESVLQEINIKCSNIILSSLEQIYNEKRQVASMPLVATLNGTSTYLGYLIVSAEFYAYRETWQIFIRIFFYIALGVMIFTCLISYYTTKKLSVPINEMADAVRRFSRGDFSARVEVEGRVDEIGQLAQAFNAMADALEGSETTRRNFIANLSHELKTPMTVIAGFSEGLLDGTIPQGKAEHYLSIIASETRRLSRLVESMLDITILDSPDVVADLKDLSSTFDISEVARLALLSLTGKIEDRKLDVDIDLPEDAIITRGDKDSINRVIYNLLDNAIKYSNPNSVIGLKLWKQGGKAYVSVENEGKPIPPHELPHIFERFHKIDKSRGVDREGVGLGLYLVKTILDKHNEDIYVTSENGQTKFMFTLTIV